MRASTIRTDNAAVILRKLVTDLRIPVTYTSIRRALDAYGDFPEPSELSAVLDTWMIANLVVEFKNARLEDVDFPVIACCQRGETPYYVLLKKYCDGAVTYVESGRGTVIEPIEQFGRTWTKIAILLWPDEQSSEINYRENRSEENARNWERRIACGGLLLTALPVLYALAGHWAALCLLGVIAAGIILCVSLLSGEYGKQNQVASLLCGLNTLADCTAVTGSRGAKVLNWLSWSEIGLVYFAGSGLAVIAAQITGQLESVLPALALVHLFVLPFTGYSIFYQARVVREWCVLCLVIQGLIWLEWIIFLTYLSWPGVLAAASRLPVLAQPGLVFLMTLGLWFLLKPLLTDTARIPGLVKLLSNYQKNPQVFAAYLRQQKRVPVNELAGEIVMGNPQAAVSLLYVSHPFCHACRQVHEEMERLLHYYGEEIKIILRFAGDPPGADSAANAVIERITRLWREEAAAVSPALRAWYATRDFAAWSARYPAGGHGGNNDLPDGYYQWYQANSIHTFPALFINGFEVSRPYTATDLKYQLKHLINAGT